MIRLKLNATLLKNINFNKKDNVLEVEYKHEAINSDSMDISISTLEAYVNSMKVDKSLDLDKQHQTMKIVHSNFKAS